MTEWTLDQQRQYLLGLAWTVQVTSEDGDLVARVAELPGLVAVGAKEKELQRELFAALEAMLDAMLVEGDPISVPGNAALPWDEGKAPPVPVDSKRFIGLSYDDDTFREVSTQSSAATHKAPVALAA